ncbi:MAG TPA: nuclear transport factor 2 family protein [Xanthomonadales bacterium]
MKNLPGLVLLLALLNPFTTLASDQECANSGDPAALENIRAQRQVFNRAIAEQDLPSIAKVLHQNIILITGTNSDVYTGEDAQLALWSEDFVSADRAVYERTPSCIRISPVVPVALEYGAWRGVRVNIPEEFASGSYAAKWRLVDGQWQLESEIFATEGCGGSFCPSGEPR